MTIYLNVNKTKRMKFCVLIFFIFTFGSSASTSDSSIYEAKASFFSQNITARFDIVWNKSDEGKLYIDELYFEADGRAVCWPETFPFKIPRTKLNFKKVNSAKSVSSTDTNLIEEVDIYEIKHINSYCNVARGEGCPNENMCWLIQYLRFNPNIMDSIILSSANPLENVIPKKVTTLEKIDPNIYINTPAVKIK